MRYAMGLNNGLLWVAKIIKNKEIVKQAKKLKMHR